MVCHKVNNAPRTIDIFQENRTIQGMEDQFCQIRCVTNIVQDCRSFQQVRILTNYRGQRSCLARHTLNMRPSPRKLARASLEPAQRPNQTKACTNHTEPSNAVSPD